MTASTTRSKSKRSHFGSVRRLPSGRWQARYAAEDGTPMTAPHTFETKAEANSHIAQVQADRWRGVYLDPRRGERALAEYAQSWIDNGGTSGQLAVRTEDLYRDLLVQFISPRIGHLALSKVTPETVRTWHNKLAADLAAAAPKKLKDGSQPKKRTGATRLGQAYRFLHAVMAMAVNDGLIAANPCRIRAAGQVKLDSRPLMTLADFTAIVDAHATHLQPALHLAFGAHLRLGELVGLRVKDWNDEAETITVVGQIIRTSSGLMASTPKTTSSLRTVVVPKVTADILREHLKRTPRALPNARLLRRPDGHPITRSALQSAWARARKKVGKEMFTLHDLRAAGLTLAAQSGATPRDLMDRAGHSTFRAAMIYQRTATERGAIIAANMDAALKDEAAS